jgi:hypothetical protein
LSSESDWATSEKNGHHTVENSLVHRRGYTLLSQAPQILDARFLILYKNLAARI